MLSSFRHGENGSPTDTETEASTKELASPLCALRKGEVSRKSKGHHKNRKGPPWLQDFFLVTISRSAFLWQVTTGQVGWEKFYYYTDFVNASVLILHSGNWPNSQAEICILVLFSLENPVLNLYMFFPRPSHFSK